MLNLPVFCRCERSRSIEFCFCCKRFYNHRMKFNIIAIVLYFNLSLAQSQTSSVTCANSEQSQEGVLIQDLFKNYDKRIKPTVNASSRITVYVQFVLTKVERLVSSHVCYKRTFTVLFFIRFVKLMPSCNIGAIIIQVSVLFI